MNRRPRPRRPAPPHKPTPLDMRPVQERESNDKVEVLKRLDAGSADVPVGFFRAADEDVGTPGTRSF